MPGVADEQGHNNSKDDSAIGAFVPGPDELRPT
jgi:hypothetical protein